jgi:hypothetical protein
MSFGDDTLDPANKYYDGIEKQSLDRLLATANMLFNKLKTSPLWGLLEDEPMIRDFMVILKEVEGQTKITFATPLETVPTVPVLWTDRSSIPRCIWQGAHGRCIYEQGKHDHKEEVPHGKDEI